MICTGNANNKTEYNGSCKNCGAKWMAYEHELNNDNPHKNIMKHSIVECPSCVIGVVKLIKNR